MAIEFTLDQIPAGFSAGFGVAGDKVPVISRELVYPRDSIRLLDRLEGLHQMIFSRIPNLPKPSEIDHLVVIINPDLSCTAYINELKIEAMVKVNRSVRAGDPLYKGDISHVESVDLGIEIPSDVGVIVLLSSGWKRSVYFDFEPLQPEFDSDAIDLNKILAVQQLLLMDLPIMNGTKEERISEFERMQTGYKTLSEYLNSGIKEESKYQELFCEHAWMFGSQYSSVDRHSAFNDANIPDFTAVRCHDNFRDIIEIKQPFLTCFKTDGNFAAGFNDSWNQAERYLSFVLNQRSYLRDEKNMLFENPSCSLVIGHDLTDEQLKKIREKESLSKIIRIYTYNHILRSAGHILNLISRAGTEPV
ncbi:MULTISPECIES: Shedu anti-phage system protein SduA domain-containing protein [Shewanella]|uniref:Shedu anti-phage system protein SduA domain-containing protein n=1 Tax=Shewanella TaxID=22 RepID=UPI003005578C